MADTTTTTLTELVNSEFINPLVLDYAADVAVNAPFVHFVDLRGKASGVAAFPQWVLDATSDITNDATDLTDEALETTETTITPAEIGIRRDVEDPVLEKGILGAGIFDFIVMDAAKLAGISLDDDICALFSSFTSSVGQTGTDLSIANMVQAQATVRQNKMFGRLVYCLDDQQALDYQVAQAAAVATTTGDFFSVASSAGSAFLGNFMGAEVWQTGLCDTANTNADVVGACYVRGDTDPTSAAIGMALNRDVRFEQERDASARLTEVVMTAYWGVGLINSAAGVKIVTDA